MSSAQAQEQSRTPARKREHVHYPFWFGGSASCFAACVTHPLDLGEFGSSINSHS
jgi:dicarboxylate transporter 10